MQSETQVEVKFHPKGRSGRGDCVVSVGGKPLLTDQISITDAKDRDAFIAKVCEGRPGIEAGELRVRMEGLAAEAVERMADKPSQSDSLLKLADDVEVFTADDVEYATVPVETPVTHWETHAIKEKGFRDWLRCRYFARFERAANTQAIQDAVDTLSARAKQRGITLPVGLRLAEHGGKVYFDLCNDRWEVIEIDGDGWRVITKSPVRFVRKRGMEAVPNPIDGGSLNELRGLLNAESEDNWILMVAWLVGAMNPKGPFPILAVNGEQGSAKSTLCEMLRQLIDPNYADLRPASRDERDLVVSASNSWVIAWDNLSGVRAEMSDAICRIATGSGFATRALYSDSDEKLMRVCRPMVFNGIEDVGTRNDLLDRAIVLVLPAIPDWNRRPESEIWERFEAIRPRLMGAIFNAVSCALRNRGLIRPPKLSRMADFELWVLAGESGLGWVSGTFAGAYARNRQASNLSAVESSPVTAEVLGLVTELGEWEGSATELLEALNHRNPMGSGRDFRSWPRTGHLLSNVLRRMAPNLRRLGVNARFDKREGRDRKRIIRLEREGEGPSASSASVEPPDFGPLGGDSADASDTEASADRPQIGRETRRTDGVDGADALSYRQSAYSAGL